MSTFDFLPYVSNGSAKQRFSISEFDWDCDCYRKACIHAVYKCSQLVTFGVFGNRYIWRKEIRKCCVSSWQKKQLWKSELWIHPWQAHEINQRKARKCCYNFTSKTDEQWHRLLVHGRKRASCIADEDKSSAAHKCKMRSDLFTTLHCISFCSVMAHGRQLWATTHCNDCQTDNKLLKMHCYTLAPEQMQKSTTWPPVTYPTWLG